MDIDDLDVERDFFGPLRESISRIATRESLDRIWENVSKFLREQGAFRSAGQPDSAGDVGQPCPKRRERPRPTIGNSKLVSARKRRVTARVGHAASPVGELPPRAEAKESAATWGSGAIVEACVLCALAMPSLRFLLQVISELSRKKCNEILSRLLTTADPNRPSQPSRESAARSLPRTPGLWAAKLIGDKNLQELTKLYDSSAGSDPGEKICRVLAALYSLGLFGTMVDRTYWGKPE